ncbi:hypothetical protein F4778DRAFT_215243 [Xylariomycetidae sp. FL2044]|nr:hypothetical protein F4778DRAFT_215243 [Xylariomycetidae sp. FL2044]
MYLSSYQPLPRLEHLAVLYTSQVRCGAMGPFALSVPSYRLGVTARKRPRRDDEGQGRTSQSPSPAVDEEVSAPQLPSDSINPLSHTPATLRQFAVAGLPPEQEIPSNLYPEFPHKSLPPNHTAVEARRHRRRKMSTTTSGYESGLESDATTVESQRGAALKRHTARLKHIGTMTAIMHRCLADGDIARAKRAFGLLVQTKEVDLRLNNLWAIGSEILMRDGEPPPSSSSDQHAGASESEARDHQTASEPARARRWGSAANVEKVKSYFENLIQQHPYDQWRPHLTSAIDFWPALFSIEIYSLDAEFRGALGRLGAEEEEEEENSAMDLLEDSMATTSAAEDDPYHNDDDDYEARRRHRREDERRHLRLAARDEIRYETQVAAQRIAARMDQLMEDAPYSTHRALLRLRGNVSLFVADLYLPARVVVGRADMINEDRMGGFSPAAEDKDKDLASRVEGPNERESLRKRKEEQGRARGFFQKVLDKGGELDDWIRRFMERVEEEDEEEEEEEEEEGIVVL